MSQRLSRHDAGQFGRCLAWIAVVTLAFIQPISRLMIYAAQSDLFSYIPLVPVVSGYLLYTRRRDLPGETGRSLSGAAIMAGAALVALAAAMRIGGLSENDHLALTTFAYVGLAIAGGFYFLGIEWMSAAAFPVGFLTFIVPLPDAAVEGIQTVSVLASTDVSAALFKITGTPLLRDGTILALPGITLRVAQECSGIRSSWVLFITSLLASNMFLRTSWRRFVLIAFVIPLGVIRNGFRILVIGLLCVHIGPQMIDSVIHHRGGPLFFALSLVPLLLLVRWLMKQESRT